MAIDRFLFQPVSIAPLVVARIVFGLSLLIGLFRFLYLGWIDEQYIQPVFHFSYFGFAWLPYPPAWGIYALFIGLGIFSALFTLGYAYRLAAVGVFVCFTYIELLDKTYYLNHYYAVSLFALIFIFLPADCNASLRVWFKPSNTRIHTPRWTIFVLQFQIGLIYLYAGLAKINPDWLLIAQPLRIWLPAHSDMPLFGFLFLYPITAYIFSWLGMFFDVLVPFALMYRRTRAFAYVMLVFFHAMTGYLFQIGMFPLIMSCMVWVFFEDRFHLQLLSKLKIWKATEIPNDKFLHGNSLVKVLLTSYVAFQLLFPWRFMLYPGYLFWTEEGYRFSWRVMLIEKVGSATFYIEDPISKNKGFVDNRMFLNKHQEKQMAMQADMILQYAHFLGHQFKKGNHFPKVTVEAYVACNGRNSSLLIDPALDLMQVEDGWLPKKWILPYANFY